jgi:DNA repair protein RadC
VLLLKRHFDSARYKHQISAQGISDSEPVGTIYDDMAYLPRERLRAMYLDSRDRLICDEYLWEGTIDHVCVYPREIACRMFETNAKKLILVHNHPSGDPTPSREDVWITNRIHLVCSAIETILYDHIVVGCDGWFSMKKEGLLPK